MSSSMDEKTESVTFENWSVNFPYDLTLWSNSKKLFSCRLVNIRIDNSGDEGPKEIIRKSLASVLATCSKDLSITHQLPLATVGGMLRDVNAPRGIIEPLDNPKDKIGMCKFIDHFQGYSRVAIGSLSASLFLLLIPKLSISSHMVAILVAKRMIFDTCVAIPWTEDLDDPIKTEKQEDTSLYDNLQKPQNVTLRRVPISFICYRCGKRGQHKIHECPTIGNKLYDKGGPSRWIEQQKRFEEQPEEEEKTQIHDASLTSPFNMSQKNLTACDIQQLSMNTNSKHSNFSNIKSIQRLVNGLKQSTQNKNQSKGKKRKRIESNFLPNTILRNEDQYATFRKAYDKFHRIYFILNKIYQEHHSQK